MIKLNNAPQGEAARLWDALGFQTIYDKSSGALVGIIPAGVVAFYARGPKQVEWQKIRLRAIGIPPKIWGPIYLTSQGGMDADG